MYDHVNLTCKAGKELNKNPTQGKLFKETHTRKHDKAQWVNTRSESIYVNFEL